GRVDAVGVQDPFVSLMSHGRGVNLSVITGYGRTPGPDVSGSVWGRAAGEPRVPVILPQTNPAIPAGPISLALLERSRLQ
ncbi:MAG TPA: hypothetical protein VJ768_11620, partial [Anaerolineales bacterium]|nr:hypothetical protein [Anaerolineales bacterium]